MRPNRTVECDSASKRKGVPARAAAWPRLEDVLLGERSQSPRGGHCGAPLRSGNSRRLGRTRRRHRGRRAPGLCLLIESRGRALVCTATVPGRRQW